MPNSCQKKSHCIFVSSDNLSLKHLSAPYHALETFCKDYHVIAYFCIFWKVVKMVDKVGL